MAAGPGSRPPLRHRPGRPALVAGAVSAVDIALWDRKARLLGLPLVDLLGASARDVPVYSSGCFTTYSAESSAGTSPRPSATPRSWRAPPGSRRLRVERFARLRNVTRRDGTPVRRRSVTRSAANPPRPGFVHTGGEPVYRVCRRSPSLSASPARPLHRRVAGRSDEAARHAR
ncbi:hypothetical protein [Streptomyces sp. NPDC056255]|uniref:hypothetical protein n=1 Tax=Streptomyces sp. NPDC056255 TaxID=3345764 RepID=UPI0035DD7FC4